MTHFRPRRDILSPAQKALWSELGHVLLAHKCKVLLQRVEAKDYVDVAALIDAGVALDRALAAARAMYGAAFQPSECLKALTFFEGGDLSSLRDEVKKDLVRAVRAVRDLPSVTVVATRLAI